MSKYLLFTTHAVEKERGKSTTFSKVILPSIVTPKRVPSIVNMKKKK